MKNKEEPDTNVVDTTLVLVPRGINRGNPCYPKTLEWHYRKGRQQTVEAANNEDKFSHSELKEKILKKTL